MRRKPPDHELVEAIQRVQIFSAAFVERHVLQQVQEKVIAIPMQGSIDFHEPRDQRILEYMIQIAKSFPPLLQGSRFPSALLLVLWLAECRAAELGYLLEGEVDLPYPTPDKQRVYKAKFPLCLFPITCLSCNQALSGDKDRIFCNSSCRSNWTTLKEQFARISDLASKNQSVLGSYGTLLSAYSLFIHNPNYKGYQTRDPEAYEQYHKLHKQGVITLFQNKDGIPVDLQGRELPDAYLITDLEDVLV